MRPAGEAAFARRRDDRTAIYTYERPEQALEPEQQARFEAAAEAWAFFSAQPPGYRRLALGGVTGAKTPETRERRLATLIEDSAAGRRLKQYTRPG
jgi:hypothetical protein